MHFLAIRTNEDHTEGGEHWGCVLKNNELGRNPPETAMPGKSYKRSVAATPQSYGVYRPARKKLSMTKHANLRVNKITRVEERGLRREDHNNSMQNYGDNASVAVYTQASGHR